jgi:DNA (cytosine-5)-methyltransferase 1
MPSYFEFFAGGGMARAGLGPEWRCLFANDFDHKKGRIYIQNWGADALKTTDVGSLSTTDLPGLADLVWASFPCQDLSLAGGGAGLKGDRSGTFWPFWNLMRGLIKEGRAPRLIVLENVCGTLNSHQGKDFAAICDGFEQAGYRVGALVVNASLFVPQSRPRLFIIGVKADIEIPKHLVSEHLSAPWHTRSLLAAYGKLSLESKAAWLWWRLPLPPPRKLDFVDVIEENPPDVEWFSPEETRELLSMMSPINRAKMADAKKKGCRIVGCVYKRTRANEHGLKVQRAEVRFDDISGCLRTPAGGSSRQVIVVVDGPSVRARLISSRETARLMGLPDSYALPPNYNEAYHLTGDGVVVPVVRHIAENIFEPILEAIRSPEAVAA